MHDVTDCHMLLAEFEWATTWISTENIELYRTHSSASFYASTLNQVLSNEWLCLG